MNRVTIKSPNGATVIFDMDGVPDVEYSTVSGTVHGPSAEPAAGLPPRETAGSAPPLGELPSTAASGPTCPDHSVPMRFRPAGTSQRTGKAYGAFYGCPEPGCKKTQDAA